MRLREEFKCWYKPLSLASPGEQNSDWSLWPQAKSPRGSAPSPVHPVSTRWSHWPARVCDAGPCIDFFGPSWWLTETKLESIANHLYTMLSFLSSLKRQGDLEATETHRGHFSCRTPLPPASHNQLSGYLSVVGTSSQDFTDGY